MQQPRVEDEMTEANKHARPRPTQLGAPGRQSRTVCMGKCGVSCSDVPAETGGGLVRPDMRGDIGVEVRILAARADDVNLLMFTG